ncbi:nucleotidyltransferase [Pedobacter psychrodurus]|uniref:nucleotidyltransferase n=1 Tax=Pedobacter psychrodurus TaxID=2530456 RepID=UPI00292F467D|nr:nucleotidyltransferase [Pedobacter psychrodurus]
MIFEPDFIEFIELLNKHEVKYMIVGAHALAFHGRPRHTGDLDIWIKPDHENAEKMINVLTEFGFASLGFKKDDFLRENYVSQIGYPPLRIDILNAISGVEFDEAYENKINAEIDDLVTPFINVQDFITNKVASGRVKDLADIKELQKRIRKKKS